MKPSLQPGLKFEYKFEVPTSKTVPQLLPEAAEFQVMPEVLATGYMVGLIEWACIQALTPHLDWPREQTVGTHVNLSHSAATPPGFTVTIKGTLTAVEGRKLIFNILAEDGSDTISEGSHERFIIDFEKFNQKMRNKTQNQKRS